MMKKESWYAAEKMLNWRMLCDSMVFAGVGARRRDVRRREAAWQIGKEDAELTVDYF